MNEDVVDFKLSSREKQVLQLVAKGLVCKQIANLLCICDTTIITYKNRLKEKLEVQNCYELIYKTTKLGII